AGDPGKVDGWLFPPARLRCGHLVDMGKQCRIARRTGQLREDLVLYCARHDYGTRVLSNTGNLAAVMTTMGHKDVRAAMQYQHPDLEIVRAALKSNKWIVRADDRIGKSAARSRTQAKTIIRQ